MGPIIKGHQGFVNQYLGDGIMAIFQKSPEDALMAAIDMQKALQAYNTQRSIDNRQGIRVGMGLHTGSLIMGIIGDEYRTDAATISDAVNTASRMESLTKTFGANILLSEQSLHRISDLTKFHIRYLGKVKVKGRKAPVGVYECFDGDPESILESKLKKRDVFSEAIDHYAAQRFSQAIIRLEEIVEDHPQDLVAQYFLREAKQYLTHGVPEGWIA